MNALHERQHGFSGEDSGAGRRDSPETRILVDSLPEIPAEVGMIEVISQSLILSVIALVVCGLAIWVGISLLDNILDRIF